MSKTFACAGLVGLTLLAASAGVARAAGPTPTARDLAGVAPSAIERVQYYGRGHFGSRFIPPGPRYGAPSPRFYGGPGVRFYGPRGYSGRPYWYSRPWFARPHYGRILAGVALGTLITVAVVGYAPPRPASNLCWYWADPSATRGYWDYCN